jgi:carboxyl-terminal processing protease
VKKRVSPAMTIFLMVLSAVTAAALTLAIVPNSISAFFGRDTAYSKLLQIESLVKNNYYDSESLDEAALADAMAKGYISAVGDKYSYYFSAEENEQLKLSNDGGSVGIGVTIVRHPDTGAVYVVNCSPDSPAGRAGITGGDQITRINGRAVTDIGYDKAVEQIRGEEGESINLTVARGDESFECALVRAQYTVCSVFARMIGELGFVSITTFNSATVDQFTSAVNDLVSRGAKGLIFDLRGNRGGTVDSVEKMLDLLLPQGTVVSAEYAGGREKALYTSDENEIDLPMAVLIDSDTASAAELFAAAVRDFDKGLLIGTKSYGKGVMQHTYDLSDGSALRITVAKFNPPSGINFNGVGLSPDIEVTLTDEQRERLYILSDDENPYIAAAVNALTE